MTRQFANAVSTTLSSSMTNTQTTMTVTSATGFPAAYPFDAHIQAELSNSDEIVQVTSLSSGTTYNITRASESYAGSSSASAHSSGATVWLVVTAGALSVAGSINPYIDATDQSSDPAAPASGAHRIYSKSTGVFVEDSTGTVTGPLGTGGGGALVGGKKQSAGPYTTSSSVMAAVDATNLDITLTTGAHRVLLLFQGVWKQTSTVQNAYFSYRIDSGSFQPHPQDVIYGLSPFNTQGFPISFALLSDALTAGSHTFSLGWATDGPTATLWTVTFQVIEQAF